MKKILFLFPLFFLGYLFAEQAIPIYNPLTGKMDLVGPGPGLSVGSTYYLYQNSTANAYFTFNGTDLCLYVNSNQKVCYSQSLAAQYLLLEDGTFFLLEDGTKLVLE